MNKGKIPTEIDWLDLYNSGISIRKLSRTYGYHPTKIRNWLIGQGATVRMPVLNRPPLQDLQKIELAYLAGFFDGEGCVTFLQIGTNRKIYPQISIGNTKKYVLDYIQNSLGGSISFCRSAFLNTTRDAPMWRWAVAGVRATEILTYFLPYLRIKKDQAEIVIEFANTQCKTREQWIPYKNRIRELNRKGRI